MIFFIMIYLSQQSVYYMFLKLPQVKFIKLNQVFLYCQQANSQFNKLNLQIKFSYLQSQIDQSTPIMKNIVQTSSISQHNIHQHFPNLTQQQFRLFEQQKNISQDLDEQFNKYQIQIEDAKIRQKKQQKAIQKLMKSIDSDQYLKQIQETHNDLKDAKGQNYQQFQNSINQKRRQNDYTQYQCDQLNLEIANYEVEKQYLFEQLKYCQVKIQRKKKFLLNNSLGNREKLEAILRETEQYIRQTQQKVNQQTNQYICMIDQLISDGVEIRKNQVQMIQNLKIAQTFSIVRKDIRGHQMRIKQSLQYLAENQITQSDLIKQRNRQVQINSFTQKLKITIIQIEEYKQRLSYVKAENDRMKKSFDSEAAQQTKYFSKQLQINKKNEMEAYSAVCAKLIKICKDLKMDDIKEEFSSKYYQELKIKQ